MEYLPATWGSGMLPFWHFILALTQCQLAPTLPNEDDRNASHLATHTDQHPAHVSTVYDSITAPTDHTPFLPAAQTISAYLECIRFVLYPLKRWSQSNPANYL